MNHYTTSDTSKNIPKPEFDEEFSISAANATSPSFKFLENEPEIYSVSDLKKRYQSNIT